MSKRILTVVLLLVAVFAFAAACLVSPPSLRAIDLASVVGVDPPLLDPCDRTPYDDKCNDIRNRCKSQNG